MAFFPTEEQRLIDDTLTRLLERHWDPRRDARLTSVEMVSGDVWAEMRDMGLLALALPEAAGGGGMGAAEVAVLFRRFGHHQVRSPFLGAMVLAGTALARSPEGALRDELLAGLVAGNPRATLAVLEDGARYDFRRIALTATGGTLSGRKRTVLEGDGADWLIVSCRLDNEPALVAVPGDSAGLRIAAYTAFDGTSLATVDFDNVAFDHGAVIARGDQALAALDDAMSLAALAAAAETLGACEGAFERTLEYMRVREQFGTPIARFQALQHRASDLHADIELLRSLVLGAGQALNIGDGLANGEGFAALALAVEVGDRVCREAIQMHGGIGMTQELGIGRYLLRVNALSLILGDVPHAARLYLEAMEV